MNENIYHEAAHAFVAEYFGYKVLGIETMKVTFERPVNEDLTPQQAAEIMMVRTAGAMGVYIQKKGKWSKFHCFCHGATTDYEEAAELAQLAGMTTTQAEKESLRILRANWSKVEALVGQIIRYVVSPQTADQSA